MPDLSLAHLLAAGVLLFPASFLQSNCQEFQIAEDGWNLFPLNAGFLDNKDTKVACLRALMKSRLLVATYRIIDATFIVRIYIAPWKDMLQRQGEDDTILKQFECIFCIIRQDKLLWNGTSASSSSPIYLWDRQMDNHGLLEIYNDLSSPAPYKLVGELHGLQSRLYPYQRRTVSAMFIRENCTAPINNPLYIPLHGVDGSVFYSSPAIMGVYVDCPQVSPVRGGILCEELGTGKTIMILALILATLSELSKPEESYHEERNALTPAVFCDTGIPSLVEITLHQCRMTPDLCTLYDQQEILEGRCLWKLLRANVPFYLHTEPPNYVTSPYSARRASSEAPKVMYLTTATLIVVPDNLQMQWTYEIMKHCTELLHVLNVQKEKLPDAPVLATDYDVVLLSHSRLSQEAKKKATDDLLTFDRCKCKPHRGTRVPQCNCSRRSTVSPLLQIRWKRLVVDEGHNTAVKRTNYAVFTKLLSVERRWIVTGTPTTNLLGLNFGSGSELQYPEAEEDEASASKPTETQTETRVEQRRWDKGEQSDFNKLKVMFSEFLMMPPFAAKPKLFDKFVASVVDRDGPFPGALQILKQVMESVMVRHRIEDVEQDVRLPFLQYETVLLDMDPYAVKTYNLIQATIAVNAIDSERKDQDYLFHPRNATHLKDLVENMSHVTFWHVDNSNLPERLSNAKVSLDNVKNRKGSAEDMKLIQDSISHIQCAMDDHVWTALQNHYIAFHRISNIPLAVADAWSMFSGASRPTYHPVPLMQPDLLMQLRDFLIKYPLKRIPDLVTMGESVVDTERKREELAVLHDRLRKKTAKEKRVRSGDRKSTREQLEAGQASTTAFKRDTAQQKLEELREVYNAAVVRLAVSTSGEVGAAPTPVRRGDMSQRRVASSLLKLSPMAGVRIGNSTSTKLDYIINEVLTYSVDEKLLIFSDSPSKLSFIADALDLVNVKYLVFSGKLSRQHRQTIVTTFETSPLYRVLLMELKHGARGLNLVSASRVIFCEPVWKADVEAQAIKRVHRIGQIRTVSVKILAIRGTSEEVMVTRTQTLKESKQESTKEATDDRTVRDFIAHPTFLPVPLERSINLDVPLFQFAPSPSEITLNESSDTLDPICENVAPRPPHKRAVQFETPTLPAKKQKQVTFAE